MRSIKNMVSMLAFLALATVAAGCGGKKLSVDVTCDPVSRERVVCDVKQTAGTDEVEACWDITADCPNGTVVTGPRTCQKVKGGGVEKTSIPSSSFEGVEDCQGGKPKLALSNLTINGKKAN